MRTSRRVCIVAGLLFGGVWTGQACADEAEARQRLAAERQALEQRFDAEERVCADRFAVNACVDDVRARRRAALAPLREQLLQVDEAERRRRADERRAAVARKQAELAQRPAVPPQPGLRLREPLPAPPAAAAATHESPVQRRAAEPRAANDARHRAQELERSRQRAGAAEARIRERRDRQREALARKGREPDRLPRAGAAASSPAR